MQWVSGSQKSGALSSSPSWNGTELRHSDMVKVEKHVPDFYHLCRMMCYSKLPLPEKKKEGEGETKLISFIISIDYA